MSRIERAISLGVRRREVPSTNAIILSRKVSPAAAVIRTTIRSESTVVPPVTALRSPPASRITGADSPVIADSSTLAIPSTTSPSPGTTWPASTTTRSPTLSWVAGTGVSAPVRSSSRATVSVRAARSDAAWALPRPSATASARLPKSTVSHSHTASEAVKTDGSTTAATVVRTDPSQTIIITGECTRCRGSSLRTAAGSWSTRLRGEQSGPSVPGPARAGTPSGRPSGVPWGLLEVPRACRRQTRGGGHDRASAMGPRERAGK